MYISLLTDRKCILSYRVHYLHYPKLRYLLRFAVRLYRLKHVPLSEGKIWIPRNRTMGNLGNPKTAC